MMWLFPRAFEYRNHRYYFCDGDGRAFPLDPGEAEKIAFLLAVVLAMGALGFFGWAVLSLYVIAGLHFQSLGVVAPAWMLDSSVLYPAVFSYWGIAVLFSIATWFGLSLRFADREHEPGIYQSRPGGSLRATRPLAMLVFALFACAFVGQGFGDACTAVRNAGSNCNFISITTH